MSENTEKVVPLKTAASKKKNAKKTKSKMPDWLNAENLAAAGEVINSALGALRGNPKLAPYVAVVSAFAGSPSKGEKSKENIYQSIQQIRKDLKALEAGTQTTSSRNQIKKLRSQLDAYLDILLADL